LTAALGFETLRAFVSGQSFEPSVEAWERACIERARSGDREAFAELYRAFAPRLYARVLMPKLGNAAAAEDALSETFRTLIEHLPRLHADGSSLWPWLCKVAANKAVDVHRRSARTRRALVQFEGLLGPLEHALDAGAEHETSSRRAALRARVGQVLAAITPRYRRAIELRFIEDLPRERCAELLEVKLGTFDVLILRALRAFRQEWEAHASLERGLP
jgi:RNA polymerase sigma-70 factor (ECF subfamily)